MQRRAAHIDETGTIDKGNRTIPARIELFGEMSDWFTPLCLDHGDDVDDADAVRGDGAATVSRSEAELALPVGVYAYKLKVDGEWALDAGNPRTRAAGGIRNNVLSVGGAPEPLLFAPAAPFLHDAERGGVVVTAGLRRPADGRLFVCWSEGDGDERRTPMELAAEEDEHLFFRARLPISSATARLRFERDADRGGALDGAFVYERPSAAEQAPAWWRDAVVYTIFVDRFRPAHDRPSWARHPGTQPAGGHLDGITRSLDALCEIGITVLYLTPIHVAASCHRYDVIDPLRVDPALGGEPALERLVDAAHARGLRVLLDLSFSHAGRGFPPYERVLEDGPASPFAAWFQWIDGAPPRLKHYGTRREAPLFNLRNPEVTALVLQTAERWAQRGIDGFRLDSAAEVPIALQCRIRRRLREIRPDAIVLAELVPAHAWRWRAAGAIDAATDFAFREVAVDWLARGAVDAAEARRRLIAIELGRGGAAHTALRFLSTHDHPRFATLARAPRGREASAKASSGHRARAREGARAIELGLLLLFACPGVPALLYGEEIGLSAESLEPGRERAPEDVWPDRAPMPWSEGAGGAALRALVQRLTALRRGSAALRSGELEIVHAEGDLLVLRRSAEGEILDIAIHAGGDEALEVALEDEALPALTPLVAIGGASVEGQTVTLPPGAGLLARRARTDSTSRQRALRIVGNPAARDADFARGALTTIAWPARIDLALTERCNLRCRHCITAAPDKTRDGTARTLSPTLVDRLREAFAFADYIGFVHGGESLTAPLFFDVLAAIRAARGDRPTTVHLLTNGALLSPRTTERLIDAGVRSISVSLDGATAATNDAIRPGARFDAILENLRGAARLRRERGADLRLGISSVVLRDNLGELDALVDLAVSVGVDWIKLEEAVPVNAFAARSLVRVDAGPAQRAVRRAIQRARERGLVAVDHTASPVVWRCKLAEAPEIAYFLAADEFANRSEIHPCRAAWEHLCVEPNGDLRLGDFFGPVLGNLAEEPLESLWNGPIARAARIRAQATRLCGAGPVTCVHIR